MTDPEIRKGEFVITVNLNVKDRDHGWVTALMCSESLGDMVDANELYRRVEECLHLRQ